MIQNADFSRYRAAEFIQFLTNVLRVIESNEPAGLKVAAQLAAVTESLAALDREYKKQTSSAITATLAELDERRDNALTGMLRVVSGFQLHFEPAKRNAARRIALVVDKYGSGVARLRYQQETGEIRSLVADLREDAAASAAMIALGVTDWLGEMDSANLAFDAAYVQRSQEMAGEPSQLLALRATALEKWQALAAHLTAHATLEPDPALAQTIAELNRLIQDYNDAATRRSGEEEPAADPTPAAPAAPAAPMG